VVNETSFREMGGVLARITLPPVMPITALSVTCPPKTNPVMVLV